MKRLMCFLMLLMIPVVGLADYQGSEESKRQKDSESTCDIKDKYENSISNPSVIQVISSEEDANYRGCLYYEFALFISDPASEVSALVCRSKGIGKIKNLGCFSGLKKLDLSDNGLEGIDLSANTALKELDLSVNYLEDAPKGLSNIESKYADINLTVNNFNGKAKEELRALKKKYDILYW